MYSVSKDNYKLPNGMEFDRSEYEDMSKYVMSHLEEFQATVLSRVNKKADYLTEQRAKIAIENQKIQLKWDKEFNRKVLDLVRQCIERGSVVVAMMKRMSVVPPDATETVNMTMEQRLIIYPNNMPEKQAYDFIRTKAEEIVRDNMIPPQPIPYP